MAGSGKKGNASARSNQCALLSNVQQDQADNTTSQEPDTLFARGSPPKTSSVALPSPITGGEQAREQDDGSPNSIYMGSDPSVGCASNNVEEIEELHGDENELAILKRKRGPTRNIALSRKGKAGVKIKVDVLEESQRLIGDGAQSFMSEASCVIRKFGKWQAPKWAKLPEVDREEMFKMTTEAKEERVIGPLELYDMTHSSRKKNGPIDERAANNLTKIKDLLSKYKDEGSNKIEDNIFVKIHSSSLQRNQTKRNGVVALFARDGCFGAIAYMLVV
ncbi:hypothetical protein ACH5RR_026783 [Cinchona calisaya]|uniref:Uncharacterized protein n=1 Tax=Cinchona calisaya TaxID=153742 RepID=A0ABD2Z3M9_9GENT